MTTLKDITLNKIKKVFFIGIGGIGISALAQMMLARGVAVSGVNDEDSPATLNLLRQAGAEIIAKTTFDTLPVADAYVYSDAWLYRGPEIIEQARKTSKPTLSYFEALGEIAKDYKVVAVSGTHGKTTTTAMIAEIMIDAGLDPTVLVGSLMHKFGSNFRKGESRYLVVEADEYRKHMLSFHPFVGVVTNIESDHLDFYKDLDEIKDAFSQFLAQSEHKISEYQRFLAKVPKLLVPGEHNRANAAAARAAAAALGIPEAVSQRSLTHFSGTARRLEKRAETSGGVIIYDDYAHHPTEIQASLRALRELYPNSKITVVFQPHLYSRTRALFSDFGKSFAGADRVLLLPIYFAREKKDESVSSERLAEAIKENGQNAESCSDFSSAEALIKTLKLGDRDILVTMGAGEAYKVADRVFNLD